MTGYETITVRVDARGVAELMLARPERHNAMNAAMIDDLSRAAVALGQDETVRVVVLAAAGASFCAGGDLDWMRAQAAAPITERTAGARALAAMLQALDTMPKPLIAKVQGPAYGGGVGLLSVCDIAIAAPSARFGLTETRLGLIPATIGPYVVARIGQAASRRYMLNARLFDADEALRIGLVSAVTGAEALDEAVEAEARSFLDCAPGAVASAKALIRRLASTVDDATIDATVALLVERWESPESAEGIAAFFSRRPPEWKP